MTVFSNGFSRKQRMLSSVDYQRVFSCAEFKAYSHQVMILARESDSSQSYPRLGLVISKKNAKQAVLRNRFKRIVRESFRVNQESLKNYDVVVLARPGITRLSKSELRVKVDELWVKLKSNALKKPQGSSG